MKRWALPFLCAPALISAGCFGQGAEIRSRVRPGMSTAEVLRIADGWFVCTGRREPPPHPDARVQVRSQSLVLSGFGAEDGIFTHATNEDLGGALAKLIRRHPGQWTFTFGYVVVPRRQYFDVLFDGDARVSAVSEVRLGGPN
jgi:hypothetical protein